MYAYCLLAALAASAPAAPSTPDAADPLPDLGLMRLSWPSADREIWAGVGVGGIYLPASISGFSRDVWTVRMPLSWAFAPTRRLRLGGRHAPVWYDSSDVRTRLSEHSGEVAVELGALDPRRRHRLLVSGEVRELDKFTINDSGVEIAVGGVRDAILGVGYGTRLVLGHSWALSALGHARYVWVFANTQRQARLVFRAEYFLRPNQAVSTTVVGHLVHRDAQQYAKALARTSVHGQLHVGYRWLAPTREASNPRLGFYLNLRGATSFLSGEAPVYEVRADGLTTPYADGSAGVHLSW